jgi:hypothetical protein
MEHPGPMRGSPAPPTRDVEIGKWEAKGVEEQRVLLMLPAKPTTEHQFTKPFFLSTEPHSILFYAIPNSS